MALQLQSESLTDQERYEREVEERNAAKIQEKVDATPERGTSTMGRSEPERVDAEGNAVWLYTESELAERETAQTEQKLQLIPIKTFPGEGPLGTDHELTDEDMALFLSGWYCPVCCALQRANLKTSLVPPKRCCPVGVDPDYSVSSPKTGCFTQFPEHLLDATFVAP